MGFDYNSFRQQSIECLFYIAHLAQSKWYFLSILVDSGKLSVFLVSCYIDKDNKMQWEFRKAVQSFENYKRTTAFKHEIEKGEESTLDIVIRQTELILNDPNQKIISKVLALRFIRDIMVLGQEDVIKKVEKLVPQLTKICSHQISNPDPDRGENYFHNHPAYIKLTSAQQKKDIDTYGSTYFILALQSILHWAQWMPFDSNGQPTIYSKAYQTLLERGVTFPSTFHYYKHSDTEKFKNMYKMEFFTDSYESAYSQSRVTSQNSQLSEVQDEKNKSGWEKRKKSKNESQVLKQSVSDQYNGETQGIKSVPEMVKILTQLKESKSRKAALLKQLHKKVQQIYETDVAAGKLKVQEANWIQRYIINYSLFSSSLIDYQEFLQRCLTEEVIIEAGVQEEKINTSNFFKASPMKPLFRKETQNSKIGGQRVIQEGNKGQQFQFKNKLISLGLELEQKNNQLAIQKSNFQKEKAETIDNYETRLQAVKAEVRKTQQDKGPFQKELENENLRLKQKIATLQLQINNNGSSTSREKEIQSQRNQLLTKVKKLEIENEKLQQIRNVTKNSEKQLATMQSRIKQKESLIEKLKGELKKWQKTSQNYQDEAALYKSELINERGKHQQKINAAKKISDSLAEENTHLKEKNLQIKKILDLKEIQNMHLKQEIKRFQAKLKEQNQKNEYDNERSEGLKSKTAFQFQEIRLQSPAVYKQIASPNVAKELFSPRNNNYSQLKYKQYEDLFFELKPKNKELFLRLCRCGLKKKDILFKQNELQIGVITEVLAQNKLRFILHFTNTSEKQIENLKIDSNLGDSSYTSSLHYAIQNKYIFCIQPQQQQKVSMTITNKESPYFKQRAILQITYEKNGSSYFNHIFLPFLIPKFCDFYKPKINNLPLNPPKESLVFRYNKKMLPKSNSLKGYFQEAVQTEAGKFQMESFHRETNLNMKIVMTMGENQSLRVDFGCNTQKVNQKQQYIFEELLSFFEIAFKK